MLKIGPSLNTFISPAKKAARGRVSSSIKDKGLREELKKLAESYSKGSLSETNLLKEVDKLSKTKAASTIAGASGNTKTALLLFVILMILTNFATTVGDTPTGKDKKKGTDTKQQAKPDTKGKAKPKDKPEAKKTEDKATKPVKGTTKTPGTKKKGEPPKAKTVAQFLEDAQKTSARAKAEIEKIDTAAQKKIADLQLGIQGLSKGIKKLEAMKRDLNSPNAATRRAALQRYFKSPHGQLSAMGPGPRLTEATARDRYIPEGITGLEEGVKKREVEIAGIRTQAEKDKAGHQAAVDDAKARGKAAVNIQFFGDYLKAALKNMKGPLFKKLVEAKGYPSHKDLKEVEKIVEILVKRATKDSHKRYGSAILVYVKIMLRYMESYPEGFAVVSPKPEVYLPQVRTLVETIKGLDKKAGNSGLSPDTHKELQKIFTSE